MMSMGIGVSQRWMSGSRVREDEEWNGYTDGWMDGLGGELEERKGPGYERGDERPRRTTASVFILFYSMGCEYLPCDVLSEHQWRTCRASRGDPSRWRRADVGLSERNDGCLDESNDDDDNDDDDEEKEGSSSRTEERRIPMDLKHHLMDASDDLREAAGSDTLSC